MALQLLLPFVILTAGALLALTAGLGGLNRHLPLSRLMTLAAFFPLGSFAWFLMVLPEIENQGSLVWQFEWLPSLGLNFSLYADPLAVLFALVVTGIGSLVVLYSAGYFKGEPDSWRFLFYLFAFMIAMLGVVLAGDVISLFVFWEATSVISFLLVGYKTGSAEARRGAFKALIITGAGGVALLLGLLLLAGVAGSTQITAILAQGSLLKGSSWYGLILSLIALAAFTKSAQFPFHIWLPEAMSAPTPASAYLHSATMVKAGIYLLARLNPALGKTDAWFWSLSLVGLMTMLAGAYLGLKQNDLKALLAYSTISQLGVLVMLTGQDTEIAFKALVIGLLAHAMYKSSLFMAAGIVDHETGTRDLRRLGGLRRSMPVTFWLATAAALSMAGLPPLFGFLAKETLLATATHPGLPSLVDSLFPAAAVLAGALLLAQAGLLIRETFLGQPRDETIQGHEPPVRMLLPMAVPALLSLAVGLLPEPESLASFLAQAAESAYGAPVKVSLALWTGINVPLLLSGVAVTLGSFGYLFRHSLRSWQGRLLPWFSFNRLYQFVFDAIDRLAELATRLQQGRLRFYLFTILAGMLGLVLFFSGLPNLAASLTISTFSFDLRGEVFLLRTTALIVVLAGSIASVLLRRDIFAILALGATGLSIAVWMALEPAPDVALVQVVVDILSMVILVLALNRLPVIQRRKAWLYTFRQSRAGLVRDLLLSAAVGFLAMGLTLAALGSRPRPSLVTPFYEENAKPLTGAKDIVGAIVVDFRALDTLIEISVFAIAGLGIYTLLRHAARISGDLNTQLAEKPAPALDVRLDGGRREPVITGIGGQRTSPFLHLLAYASLPLAGVLAALHILFGHDQPGDGFTAAVIVGLAIGFWYVVLGYAEMRRRLTWFKAAPLLIAGLSLAVLTGLAGLVLNGIYFSPVDFGALIGLSPPEGINFSTSLLFESAIFLSVLGSLAFILNTLGHPGRMDPESMEVTGKKPASS